MKSSFTVYNVTYPAKDDVEEPKRFYTSRLRRAWISKYRRHVGVKQKLKLESK